MDFEGRPCSRDDGVIDDVDVVKYPLVPQVTGPGVSQEHPIQPVQEVITAAVCVCVRCVCVEVCVCVRCVWCVCVCEVCVCVCECVWCVCVSPSATGAAVCVLKEHATAEKSEGKTESH